MAGVKPLNLNAAIVTDSQGLAKRLYSHYLKYVNKNVWFSVESLQVLNKKKDSLGLAILLQYDRNVHYAYSQSDGGLYRISQTTGQR